jgi:hypothetical protein
MPEPESAPAAKPFVGARTASTLMIMMLLGLAGVAAFSTIDHPRAAQLESFSQTTAVEEKNTYRVPAVRLAVPDPVLTWQGRKWAPANYDKVKINDTDMAPVGKDEASGFSVYQVHGETTDRAYYLKIDIGEYLRLEPR